MGNQITEKNTYKFILQIMMFIRNILQAKFFYPVKKVHRL